MSEDHAAIADGLARRLLLPLATGAEVRLVRPIGERRAVELIAAAPGLPGDVAGELSTARLRVLRTIAAIDDLPDLSDAEWLLACALNDLLQATHPDLDSVLARGRSRRLIEGALGLIERAGTPGDLADALARHATFCRAPRLVRHDRTVRWWTGSRAFLGTPVPARVKAWPTLRRVTEVDDVTPLGSLLPPDHPELDVWRSAVARWLAATPLTDLATADRELPAFHFTGASLAVLASPAGRSLARRMVIARGAATAVVAKLREASVALRSANAEARGVANAFLAEFGAA